MNKVLVLRKFKDGPAQLIEKDIQFVTLNDYTNKHVYCVHCKENVIPHAKHRSAVYDHAEHYPMSLSQCPLKGKK
jgi:hypothetical protein